LKRIEAYIFGVLSILAGQAVWLLLQAQWLLYAALASFALIAGGTTVVAYAIDWALNRQVRERVGAVHDGHD